ncbi:MAG TPA: M23 family metallopeptidase [Stellaceae bacterium]|nr:M23 family metallopeptidase [Stellaceae bacterium]
MGKQKAMRHRLLPVAVAMACAGLAGCAYGPSGPAPVIFGSADSAISPEAMVPSYRAYRPPAPLPSRAPRRAAGARIVVRPGQSLDGIAAAYHVSGRAIIAANHLRPPYKLETGWHLLIPGADEMPVRHELAATPRDIGRRSPDIIPLDGPAPSALPERRHPPVAALTPPADQTRRPAGEPSAAEEARAEAAPPAHRGHFLWPVHGHVVEGYGVAAGGARNDGINIAAPRGTPVDAIDSGVVAYAGNELRGYGNLVLIKHEGGWISAYAHCQELLVKRGERVRRGQIIARVGETGGVSAPQLHFELRRGQRAVDPREYLAPAPAASASETARRG